MDEKKNVNEVVANHGVESSDSSGLDADDTAVKAQMGKKQQLKVDYPYTMYQTPAYVFQRRFNFISILALSATLLSSWEALGS